MFYNRHMVLFEAPKEKGGAKGKKTTKQKYRELLDEHGDAEKVAKALIEEIASEGFRYRRRIRTLQDKVTSLEEGSYNEKLEAYEALGTLEDLKNLQKNKEELETKVKTLEGKQNILNVAEVSGLNHKMLQKYLPSDLSYKVGDAKEKNDKGETTVVQKGFVVVKNGEESKEHEINEYLEANYKELLPILKGESNTDKPVDKDKNRTNVIRQKSSSNATVATDDDFKEEQNSRFDVAF